MPPIPPALRPTCLHALAAVALLLGTPAHAQSDWREFAIPVVNPPQFVRMQTEHWYRPRSAELATASGRLQDALKAHCSGGPIEPARAAWRDTLVAWDKLSAVAVGPLLERRSARRIDFQPTRPALIEKALAASAQGTPDMDRVGSAARGFAALEWLLWTPSRSSGAPACRLMQALAADIGAEADALRAGFAARESDDNDEAAVVEQMSEAVNQWIGGLELLRMQAIERPLREAETKGLPQPELPRHTSGATAADRGARWSALRVLAVLDAPRPPPTGTALLPLEMVLRGKGLNPLADRLVSAVRSADGALLAAQSDGPQQLAGASAALDALHRLVELEVAPALDIRIGFSDADGD